MMHGLANFKIKSNASCIYMRYNFLYPCR